MTKYEVFIPRKFKGKITPQDTEAQKKKIKACHNLLILKAQAVIPEDKTILYKTKYHEIDHEQFTEIRELCPIETQQVLIDL